MDEIIKLIGSPQGPGWGTLAAFAAYMARLAVRLGELQGLVRGVATCPKAGCPFASAASDMNKSAPKI